MKPARLELDHIAPRRRRGWPGYALLALSLCVAGYVMLSYQETGERLQAAAAVAPVARPARPAPAGTTEAEEKIARGALRQLALPWGGLVRALEGASTGDVALLQLQPEADAQVLRITAEARNSTSMFRYLQGLREAKGLSEVHLLRHEIAQDDPQHPVRFSAQASFRGIR